MKNYRYYQNTQRKEIPIFFASDDNYVPYMAVALNSLIKNASKNFDYKIKILTTGISEENMAKLKKMERPYVDIDFVDVKKSLSELKVDLHTRDYYTNTTYFRLFIPDLFPQYKKALYLDGDIVVKGDISKFYNINIGNRLVGAITDEAVSAVPEFVEYVEKCLGMPSARRYFNAGILIMNLHQFRKQNFIGQFTDLLEKYKFTVAQDQDYLNVVCKNKVFYISNVWNKMPLDTPNFDKSKVQLIHYNLSFKPWKLDNILYEEHFWEEAKETEYYDFIKSVKDNYPLELKEKTVQQTEALKSAALLEARSPVNYYKLYVEPTENGGQSGEGNLFDLELNLEIDETSPAKI